MLFNSTNKITLRCCLAIFILWFTSLSYASSPQVLTSIKPFYNICAYVMQSAGSPKLLLGNNSSPHDYQLKPSDLRKIQNADLIIWGGPNLEGFLAKPLSNSEAKIQDLAKTPGLKLLKMRSDANWQHDHSQCNGHNHNHNHNHNKHITSSDEFFDPHFWLDPDNAIIIAKHIAKKLSVIDPINAKIYEQNAKNFAKKIHSETKVWQVKIKPARNKPYIVFHDGFQYFNDYFGLDGIGAISINPEIPPSAKRLQEITELLEKDHIACIFREPQFDDKLIKSIIYNNHIYSGVLDPLGNNKNEGINGYFKLIDNLVDSFYQCGKFI